MRKVLASATMNPWRGWTLEWQNEKGFWSECWVEDRKWGWRRNRGNAGFPFLSPFVLSVAKRRRLVLEKRMPRFVPLDHFVYVVALSN